jgi:uncharacterized protein
MIKNIFYGFALFFLSFCANSQENNPLNKGFDKGFHSKILEAQRNVWIHIPAGMGENDHKGNGLFPVIYLLDGESNFSHVVSITEFMSNAGLCPPMIVVGILHPDRMTDLTFGTDKGMPGIAGKGEIFMRYIEKELMPYIDSTYPTAPYKIFIGHSVGGLTVINTLLHRPDLFNAYVSLDGALWWNNQRVVTEAKLFLSKEPFKGKALFIALANRMEKGMDTLAVQKDTTEGTELIRSNLEFIKYTTNNRANQLRFRHKYYENDDHSSVRLIGEYDALRFIFENYKLKIYNSYLQDPDFKLDSLLITHYASVTELMGFQTRPPENQVNGLAYYMLRQNQLTKAEALFKLNVTNYPETANCYDGLGDLYLAKGDKPNAIANFKKALSLMYVPETKQKLDILLKEK